MTFADKIVQYNAQLNLDVPLPDRISVMNPYQDALIRNLTENFYRKFYSDTQPRHLIMGINPGRFGAGVTGIPFTDSIRLRDKCGIISNDVPHTKELSSDFVYKIVEAYGGAARFYGDFYINSVCPLGFTKTNDRGKEVNYNYYDSPELTKAVYDFMVKNIEMLLNMGFESNICYCLGTGKNAQFLEKLNAKYRFFDKIIPLEHPRFVMQYKLKHVDSYVDMYLEKLNKSIHQL